MSNAGDKKSMDINPKDSLILNFDILPPETKSAFDFLSSQPWLSQSGWYLAGGTALALQAKHRRSVDLDFFTTEKDFDKSELLSNFLGHSNWKTTFNRKNTIYGELLGAKVSFIAFPFFVPKQEFISYGAVRVLSSLDIAVMKIIAISQRGRKRDFFDLYWCAKNIEPLEETIKRLKIQYPTVAHDYPHILKSLVYFVDAESDPEPEIFFKTSWQGVKDFFEKEIPTIIKELIIKD